MSTARLALCAALLGGAIVAFALAYPSEPEAPPGAPNIVVIMADDQARNTFTPEAMPNTQRLFDEGGTRFPNALAVPPLCCPARAGLLTGQYPHNHGVTQNFYEWLRDPANVLSTWLDEGGYEVGLAGKFLNEYTAEEPAPGFDYWWELRGNPGYYDYEVLAGDELEQRGSEPGDYSTLGVTSHAVDFVHQAAEGDDPFFLWASYYAPHAFNRREEPVCAKRTAQVLPSDWARFDDAPVPRPPAFDERDISDKAPPSRDFKRIAPAEARQITEDVRCSMAAMYRVDAGIGEIEAALREEGVARNTAIFYLSDNGYFFGEHRRHDAKEKAAPYEGAIVIPMAARIPPRVLGGKAAPEVSEPVGTIDLAPTIVELAGAQPCFGDDCRTMDGRSLLGLIRGDDANWPASRPVLLELGDRCGNFASLRNERWMYTEFYDGDPPDCVLAGREMYDLRSDPHQLESRLGPATRFAPGVQERESELAARLAELRECSGVEGRDETDRPC